MADTDEGYIGDSHDIMAPPLPKMMMMIWGYHCCWCSPWRCRRTHEGIHGFCNGDGEAESGDDNNNQAYGDTIGGPHGPRGPWDGHRYEGSQGPTGPVAPVFMNLQVKCPPFSTNNDEDMESHLLSSNDWMNSQGIAEDAKCGRFCLKLDGNAYLWYELITLWVMTGIICKDFFPDNSP